MTGRNDEVDAVVERAEKMIYQAAQTYHAVTRDIERDERFLYLHFNEALNILAQAASKFEMAAELLMSVGVGGNILRDAEYGKEYCDELMRHVRQIEAE